jgi:hypothetical protein
MLDILDDEYTPPDTEYTNEIMELIEYHIDREPDKRTKLHKVWLKRMNELVKIANKLAKATIYKQFTK